LIASIQKSAKTITALKKKKKKKKKRGEKKKKKKKKKKKGEKKLGEKKFRVIASVCIENKTYKVTLTWLSLKLLKDKVKELIITNQHKPKDTEFDFTISDANGQPIDNFSKLRTVFETNPVNFL
ncbi:hypothetical protein RFI_39528, partial [Reticulomyxa filosa]